MKGQQGTLSTHEEVYCKGCVCTWLRERGRGYSPLYFYVEDHRHIIEEKKVKEEGCM